MINENEMTEIKTTVTKNMITINSLESRVNDMKNNINEYREKIKYGHAKITDFNNQIREQHYIIKSNESLLKTEEDLILIYDSYIKNMSETNSVIQKLIDTVVNNTIDTSPSEVIKEKWIELIPATESSPKRHHMARDYWSFEDARSHVRKQKLRNHIEWKEWSCTKRPDGIPSQPQIKYQDQWVSWPDWFGTENKARKTLSLWKK